MPGACRGPRESVFGTMGFPCCLIPQDDLSPPSLSAFWIARSGTRLVHRRCAAIHGRRSVGFRPGARVGHIGRRGRGGRRRQKPQHHGLHNLFRQPAEHEVETVLCIRNDQRVVTHAGRVEFFGQQIDVLFCDELVLAAVNQERARRFRGDPFGGGQHPIQIAGRLGWTAHESAQLAVAVIDANGRRVRVGPDQIGRRIVGDHGFDGRVGRRATGGQAWIAGCVGRQQHQVAPGRASEQGDLFRIDVPIRGGGMLFQPPDRALHVAGRRLPVGLRRGSVFDVEDHGVVVGQPLAEHRRIALVARGPASPVHDQDRAHRCHRWSLGCVDVQTQRSPVDGGIRDGSLCRDGPLRVDPGADVSIEVQVHPVAHPPNGGLARGESDRRPERRGTAGRPASRPGACRDPSRTAPARR